VSNQPNFRNSPMS